MADEQIIYLSPEEEFKSVRERLERIPTQRIILVVPAQTQLRSHVGWRLLHARARELGKEILIISSDRQIRSVVKAAGFRVTDSLESSPMSKKRSSSRTGRSILGGRPSSRVRTPPGRDVPGLRIPNQENVNNDRPAISDYPTLIIDVQAQAEKNESNVKALLPYSNPTDQGREHIGNYQLVRQIGQGALGRIYLAEDVRFHHHVSLTVLHVAFKNNKR